MKTIVGLGEILIDQFPEYDKPGGAPCNLVYNLSRLGHRAFLVSATGQDEAAGSLRDFLHEHQLSQEFVQYVHKPSGTVGISFEDDEARYEIHEDVAWDAIQWTDALARLAAKTDAVCFSTLAQRSSTSRETIMRFLEHTSPNCLKVLDVNLRPPFYSNEILMRSFHHADVVKMNAHEHEVIAGLLNTETPEQTLVQRFGVELVILTLGRRGSRCISREGEHFYPVQPVDERNGDSVGVGDAFLACAIHHLLQGRSEADMMRRANAFAGWVASQKGAMVSFPDALIESVS
ncbi:MAG: carbohydrate kinase family protein [Cyclonatronaceae bacterium]